MKTKNTKSENTKSSTVPSSIENWELLRLKELEEEQELGIKKETAYRQVSYVEYKVSYKKETPTGVIDNERCFENRDQAIAFAKSLVRANE